MKKFMLRAIPVIMVALIWILSISPVYALNIDTTFNMKGNTTSTASNAVANIWGTVLLILQVLAVAAIVFAGVRYMFAGADEKAEIKSGLIVLAIGAVLVFGASTIVRLLVNVTNEVANVS